MKNSKFLAPALGLLLSGPAARASLPEIDLSSKSRPVMDALSQSAKVLADAAARSQNQGTPVVLPGGKPQDAPKTMTRLESDQLGHFLKLAAYAWKKQGGTLAVIYRRARHSDVRNLWGTIYPRNGVYLQVKGTQRPDGSLELGQMLLALKIGRWPPYAGETIVFAIDPQGNISDDVRLEVDDSDDMPDPMWRPDQFYAGSRVALSGAQDDLDQAIQVMMRTHIVAGHAVTRPLMGFVP